MNKAETMKLLSILSSVWSNEPIDDAKITAYQWALSDVTYAAVEQAAKTLLRSAKFFPKPAEILELIISATVPEIPAGEAFEIVQRQIRKHGYAGLSDCDFGDEAITQAVRMVGWRRLCLDEDQKFIRRDFDAALETCQQRIRKDVQSGSAALPAAGEIVQLPRRAS